jgi:mycothiol synthase
MPTSEQPDPDPAGPHLAPRGQAQIRASGPLAGPAAEAVLRLVAAAAEEDGVAPLSEHVMLHLRYGGDSGGRNLLLSRGAELAGYAHLDLADQAAGPSGELVIDPAHRQHGLGLALVSALVAEAGERPLRLWAHGDLPAASRLAAAAGFERVRALWQMRRSLRAPLARPQLASGLSVRTFVIGRDEAAWTDLNSRAFSRHPEQGAWTQADLDLREREPWFDPAGFFLAERDGKLVGFHWTKIHGQSDEAGAHEHEVIGEVYVVGVDPDERGTGLGRALTMIGLRYLRSRGLSAVMLYVDEDNTPAIRLYESLGFTHRGTDVMFGRGPGPRPDASLAGAGAGQVAATDASGSGRTPSTLSSSSAVSGRSLAATALRTSAYRSISPSAT